MSKLSYVLALVIATLSTGRREDKGATAVEYALVIGLVSIVVVGAVAAFGPKITTYVSGLSFG